MLYSDKGLGSSHASKTSGGEICSQELVCMPRPWVNSPKFRPSDVFAQILRPFIWLLRCFCDISMCLKCYSLHVKCFIVPLKSVADKGYILITACFSLMAFLLCHCIGVHMNVLFPVIKKINYSATFLSCHSFCGYCLSLFPG